MMPPSRSRSSNYFEILGRLTVTAAAYPFEYIKVLIQLGYEPYPPRPSYTFLGKPCHILPGCFEYMRYVRKVDGFTGLYRGLTTKLCCTFVSGTIFTSIKETRLYDDDSTQRYIEYSEGSQEDSEESEDVDLNKFFKNLLHGSIARSASILASHPFYVITIRKMAQFIGRETIYNGIGGSIKEIYEQEGILGFFKGLAPRLIADLLSLWVSATASHLAYKYIFKEKAMKGYINASLVYVSNALTYPFHLVCNIMCVNNTRLMAGGPPCMPIYVNWIDCWSNLSANNQLKRGSGILWRYYTGPPYGKDFQHRYTLLMRYTPDSFSS